MKELLITTGFPRSGNTYLNYALHLLFYSNQEINYTLHWVSAIKVNKKILVPFRNPLDSISSWHSTFSDGSLEDDIKYYIRFYSHALDNLDKVVLIDFDNFTQDIDYIQSQVLANFGLESNELVTADLVKKAMLANNKEINLPRNNQQELALIKSQLESMPELSDCLDIYEKLKLI